ncbi:MAG: ABC transporter substrate-binding protein [Candidatus Dormibacteraceae bacterium]
MLRARSRRARLLGFCLGAVLLAGCRISPSSLAARISPARGGSVTEAIVGVPGMLNPLLAQDASAHDIDRLIYQGLTSVDGQQRPRPLLASGWTLSPDRLTYTFTLRPGVRWADGRPLLVEDVLFTFEVLQDPTYAQGADPWQSIKVARAGRDRVSFTLKAPSVSFPFLLTIGIIPAHAFRSGRPADVARDPHSGAQAFGTGPFMVQSISADHRTVTLRRNPYGSPAPYLDHFVFHAYPTLSGALNAVIDGEADAVGGVQPPQLPAVANRGDLAVHEQRTFAQMAVFLDLSPLSSGYFGVPQVRQALNRAIDRRAIIGAVLDGHADVATGPIPPTNWAYSPRAAAALSHDRAAAARGLDAEGWRLPVRGSVRERAGKSFEVTLVTPDAYPYREVAEQVHRQLAAIGVRVVLDKVPSSILVGRYLIPREYQMALTQLDSGPDADQSAFWHSGASGGGLNFTPVPRQALIDKDLEDAEAATTRAARMPIYDDFQRLLAQAAPAIYIYEPHYLYVVNTRVHGVRMNRVVEPVDRFRDVARWYVVSTGG